MTPTAAVAGLILTVFLSLLGLAFRLGHHSARLEALESWRNSIRIDMHEVSEITKRLEVGQATVAAQIMEIKNIIDRRDWSVRSKV